MSGRIYSAYPDNLNAGTHKAHYQQSGMCDQ